MRSIWMLISSAVVVAITGATVYCFTSEQVSHGELSMGGTMQTAPEVSPSRNPLLTANMGQFDRWVPRYPINCGQILYEHSEPGSQHYSFCIREIRKRVSLYTMQDVSRDDVLNSDVRARWHKVIRDQ